MHDHLLANLKVLGEVPKAHGTSQFVQLQNTIASRIGFPFAEKYYFDRERKKVAALVAEQKEEEATALRERLLDRAVGGIENRYFSGLFTREHTPEERRFAMENRRRIDLKKPSEP